MMNSTDGSYAFQDVDPSFGELQKDGDSSIMCWVSREKMLILLLCAGLAGKRCSEENY